jgi:polysaccharide biosynthesis transport protein
MNQMLSPAYLLSVVRRRALYVLIPLILGVAATVGIVMSLPAIYTSKATILVESQQIPADLVRSTITALASERLQVIEQRIMARDNVLEIARKYKLFAKQPNLSITDLVEKVKARIKIEQTNLGVKGGRGSDRLTVAFAVSYELVTSILGEDVKARTGLASETSRFLEKEVSRLSLALADVETRLGEARLQNLEALPEKLQFNMNQLEKTQKSMVDIERQLLSIEENKRFLSFEQSVRVAASKGTIGAGGKDELSQRINALKSELLTLSVSYSESHPEMRIRRKALQALEAEKATIDKAISQTVSDAPTPEAANLSIEEQVAAQKLKTLDDRTAFLKAQLDTLTKTADELQVLIEKAPEIAASLISLEREQAGLQGNLDEMSEKLDKAKLAERLEQDQQAERFEVIEQPIRPQAPSSPDRPKLMALGSAVAAALGLGLAFVTEMFDGTIRTVSSFEGHSGLRPLVVLPYITNVKETQKRRVRTLVWCVAVLILLLLAAAAVHFFYTPLDLLYYRLLRLL